MNGHVVAQEILGWMTGSPLGIRLVMVSVELAVLAAAAWALLRVFRGSSPRFRALVWLVVLAKPVAGLLIGAPLSVAHMETKSRAGVVVASNDNGESGLDALLAARLEADRARLESRGHSTIPQTFPPTGATVSTGEQASAPAVAVTPSGTQIARTGTLFLGAWWGGMLAMVGLWARDSLRIRRMRRRSTPAPEGLVHRLEVIARETGLRRTPLLRLTSDLESPALTGLMRPVIFLPERLAESTEGPAVDWALRHEVMHCRHRDPWALLLRRVAEVLFYFHPVVWWTGRKWEESAELACDRALVATNAQAREYAGKLYALLEMQQARRRYALGQGLFATRTQIGNRIAALLADPLRSPARLSAVSFLLVLGIAAVAFTLGLGTTRAAETAAVSPLSAESGDASTTATLPSLTAEEEEAVRTQLARARSDLRSLHTALEAYRVDNDTYPDNLLVITTPIAYLSTWLPDPFAEPGPEYLKMRFTPDWSAIRLYSVGPDGIDDQGEFVYDPTNGTISEGDIVRTVDLHDYVAIANPEISKQYTKQKADLDTVATALDAWFLKYRDLPESLESLKSEGLLKTIPDDDFVPNQALSYRFDKATGEAVVYSVGPDRSDGGGKTPILGRFGPGEIPPGDVVVAVSMAELEKRFPSEGTKPEGSGTAPYLRATELLKRKEGRDNALYHYALLDGIYPGNWTGAQNDLANRVIKEGWSEEADPLLPLVAVWQRGFEEIRKGAALDYAQGIGFEKGPRTPVPNFLAVQTAAKMLVVQGRYRKFQGKPAEALDDYLDVLTMGRDFSSPGNLLISHLIGIAVRNIALKPVYNLVYSGVLDRATLERLGDRLRVIDETCGEMDEAFEGERQCHLFAIDNNDVKLTPKDIYVSPEQAPTVKAQVNQYWQLQFDYLRTPYWERDPARHKRQTEALLQSSHPLLVYAMPNVEEADVRFLVSEANLRLCRIATALALYRLDNDRFPSSLADLSPTYLDPITVDPFSGELFTYTPNAERTSYRLSSVGPLRSRGENQPNYDPTNGTMSAGVISFE